jgi:hypothetical protein
LTETVAPVYHQALRRLTTPSCRFLIKLFSKKFAVKQFFEKACAQAVFQKGL